MAKSKASFNKKSLEIKKKKKREEKFGKKINKKFLPKATFEDMLVPAESLVSEETA